MCVCLSRNTSGYATIITRRMNPSWGASIPSSGSIFAPQMAVGAFSTTMTSKVPLNTPITGSAGAPTGWSKTGTGSFYKGKDASRPTIGDVKVTLYSNELAMMQEDVLLYALQVVIELGATNSAIDKRKVIRTN